MKWLEVPRDEQETVINIDYAEKKISVYTNRKATAKRLLKKIGEPTFINKNQDMIYSVGYERSFFDKDVAKFFSKTLLIGTFRTNNIEEV